MADHVEVFEVSSAEVIVHMSNNTFQKNDPDAIACNALRDLEESYLAVEPVHRVTPPSSPVQCEQPHLRICHMTKSKPKSKKPELKKTKKKSHARKTYTGQMVEYLCLLKNEEKPKKKHGLKKDFRSQRAYKYTAAKGRMSLCLKSTKKTKYQKEREIASLNKTITSFERNKALSEEGYFYEFDVSIDPVTIQEPVQGDLYTPSTRH